MPGSLFFRFRSRFKLKIFGGNLAIIRAAEPELGILPGALIKNQKQPDLSLKFRTGARSMII